MNRKEAKYWLNKLYARTDITNEYGDMEDMQPYEEAVDMAISALEQEPCNTDTCKVVKAYMNEWDKPNNSDAISRQAVLDCLTATKLKKFDFILQAREEIKALPPVNPQPKIGKWQQDLDGKYLCSECGIGFKEQPTLMGKPMFLWCPLCGAKMQEG